MKKIQNNKKSTDQIIRETFNYLRAQMPTEKAIKLGSMIEKEFSNRISKKNQKPEKMIF